MLTQTSMSRELEYGGFWIRAAALMLDGMIALPIAGLSLWLSSQNLAYAAHVSIAGIVFTLFYEVYLVQRFGGTPGKLMVGLRIVGVDGAPVTVRQAFLREAPDLGFAICGTVGLWIAVGRLNGADSGSFLRDFSRLTALMPFWIRPLRWVRRIWNWSELIVLLTNEKRRALHDFIAGTVVVRRSGTWGTAAHSSKADVVKAIDDFLGGSGGRWDWDDFISIRLDDPVLEHVRLKAASLPDRFPPTLPGHYASAEGMTELRRLADTLRD